MKKGDITLSILNALKDGAGDFEDIVVAYLNAGYGASVSKLRYEKRKAEEARMKRVQKRAQELELRKKCSRMVYYLKKSGLISQNRKFFNTTDRGKKKLDELREKMLKNLPLVDYPKEKAPQLVLVSFDVPEKERRKRAWLRDVLRYLDFKMVHKSVWLGKFKIPKRFVEDLRKMHLIDFVEILSVDKEGTLEKIV
jgi:DNA-binding transcriptional regulator PaaX